MGALKQHTLRTHVQARVWAQAAIPQQDLLDPVRNGYHKEHDGQLTPTTTDVPPAPDAIIKMVRCKCKGDGRLQLSTLLLQVKELTMHRSLSLQYRLRK